uniref:Uncharacterized protein n=1 Tax=Arundo donax TaxID=35708 RepID=A0A0A9F1Y0_ARUDO
MCLQAQESSISKLSNIVPWNITVLNHSLPLHLFFPLSICEPSFRLIVMYSLQNLQIVQTKRIVIHSSRMDHTRTQTLQPTNKIAISIKHGNSGTCVRFFFLIMWYGNRRHYCVSIPICCRADFMTFVVKPSTPMIFELSSATTSCKGYLLTVWILFAGTLNSPFRMTVRWRPPSSSS